MDLGDSDKVTIMDGLFQIQQTQDKTLSFRYSCRLAMCGSCAVVINGKEGLALQDHAPGYAARDDHRGAPAAHSRCERPDGRYEGTDPEIAENGAVLRSQIG